MDKKIMTKRKKKGKHNCWCSIGWEWDPILRHKKTCLNKQVPRSFKDKI